MAGRYAFHLLALLFAIAGHDSSAADTTATQNSITAEIRAVLRAQAHAWNRGDVDGYMRGYANSRATEFISGDTLTRGWQTVHDRYAKKYDSREKMGALDFSDLRITIISNDAALATGRWKLTRKRDQPRGRFTLLFRRTTEGWRIVHDHTSSADH